MSHAAKLLIGNEANKTPYDGIKRQIVTAGKLEAMGEIKTKFE